jgi:N-acetyl sugar amidotransferase
MNPNSSSPNIKVCRKCLYDENHPLGITFNEDDICSGCEIHLEKTRLDWDARLEYLKSLTQSYRSPGQKSYDCIVPVSGGRDSFFIVHTVTKVLGMKPLLVSYNKHYNTPEGIHNLNQLKTVFDCDHIQMNVNPQSVQAITRHTLDRLGSIYWHCIAGETVYPVQTAVRFKVPLIIWGAHQGLDQTGMYSHLNEVEMSRKYRKDHDLMGVEAEDLLKEDNCLSDEQLTSFLYPHNREIESVGVRGIYLGNFIPWDTKTQHELMQDQYDYSTRALQKTFDCYNDVDSHLYSGIHDWIKYLKHGYGKATDHACREIRWERISRKQGEELIALYQSIIPRRKEIKTFTEWLGMEELDFIDAIQKHSRFGMPGDIPENENLVGNSTQTILPFRSKPYAGEYAGKEDYLLIGKCYHGV